MAASNYDIAVDQGSTFRLFVEYQTSGSTGIDLNGYVASMQVRRTYSDDQVILSLSGTTLPNASAVTGGGSPGEFSPGVGGTGGVSGTGGILLNGNATGATGYTGGVFIDVDAVTMATVPHGRHLYDLELNSDGVITKLIKGRFEVAPEVTRRW